MTQEQKEREEKPDLDNFFDLIKSDENWITSIECSFCDKLLKEKDIVWAQVPMCIDCCWELYDDKDFKEFFQ